MIDLLLYDVLVALVEENQCINAIIATKHLEESFYGHKNIKET
jgi:hypothetical protein